MRLAWFTPRATDTPEPSDDTALLIRALDARHTIDVIDAPCAHDFVWQQARNPFDVCVFELGGTPAHQFIAPYAVHYSGIVILRGVPRHDRALQAARLVVVPHQPVAEAIADDYPGTRVRTLVPGVEALPEDAGDVINALRWPPDGAAVTYALAGFAARRAVLVFDGPETADWPSLDPQNWVPRAPVESEEPICVSIDPRDEAHSLRLALRRLEQDGALRARLGAAAHTWWRQHATVQLAADGFERLLEEVHGRAEPAGNDGHNGTDLTRQILSEFSLEPSALGPGPW
jgi:hypothetical protein